MTIYAHRGNIDGPQPDKENSPAYIEQCIGQSFYVEIDLRYINGSLFLGHDYPQYAVTTEWLIKHSLWLLIHAKDAAAARFLHNTQFHYFCHKSDPFTLTSSGAIWTHDLSIPFTPECIVPVLTIELMTLFKHKLTMASGICTDFAIAAREMTLKQ